MQRLALATILLCAGCEQPLEPQPPVTHSGRVTLVLATRPVELELAFTPAQRAQGLKNRTSLGADQGMLFVFPSEAARTFWMHQTLIPLDMLFLDGQGRVLNVLTAPPGVEKPGFSSQGPARFVIELNAGWCGEHGLLPGTRVAIPAEIAALAKD